MPPQIVLHFVGRTRITLKIAAQISFAELTEHSNDFSKKPSKDVGEETLTP